MSNVDWDLILETIRAERCVVLLGPAFASLQGGKSLENALIEHLDLNKNPGIKYYAEDSLLHFQDPILRTRTYFKVKAFYRSSEDKIAIDRYKKLAGINFHLYVSTSPDHFLKKVMEGLNVPANFAFYNKTSNPQPLPAPSKQAPMIYNMFGSIEEEQSMILSHNDLYDFIFSILGDHRLPEELQNTLHNTANIIFLGFNFGKWYMQLLLRLLNLHEEGFNFDRYASSDDLQTSIQVFVHEQFKINFVEGSVDDFVNTLYSKCEAQGLLRELQSSDTSVFDRVNTCLENDNLEPALELLSTFFEAQGEEDLKDEVTLLSGRYKRLQRKINQEVIEANEAEVASNKIRVALLELNKEVKEMQ